MTRILVLGSLPSSLVHFRRELLKAMVAQGHEVHACSPPAEPEVTAKLSAMGVHYHPVHLNRAGLNLLEDAATLTELSRLMKRIRPEVFFGYTAKPVIYGSLAARRAGTPHIFSIIEGLGYAFSGRQLKRRLLAGAMRSLYRLALAANERVFFLNPDDREAFAPLLGTGAKAFLLGGIGVDLAHFVPTPFPPRITFFMAGRLLWDKGIRHYVEAARLVRQRHPQARFLLAGAMDENPTCVSRRQLDEWIAEGHIEYLGVLQDVRPALAATSIFVLPSYREGVPVTVMEAMAAGRPIITTDAPGCRETVREGSNGFLVPVADSEALAAAMERLIGDPVLIPLFGAQSRRMAEERFDVHEVNARLLRAMGLWADSPESRTESRRGTAVSDG